MLSEKVKRALLGQWYDKIVDDYQMEALLNNVIDDVVREYASYVCYPKRPHIFRAFRLCPYDKLKVVFLGQDPFHDGSATGLCFANETESITISPSLQILKREYMEDTGNSDLDKSLEPWAEQGVLLLNRALTVRKGQPKSHFDIWYEWTSNFLDRLSADRTDLIYVMFGKKAQEFKSYIHSGYVLNIVHPAAEAYSGGKSGFYGCRMFSKINSKLVKTGHGKIDW